MAIPSVLISEFSFILWTCSATLLWILSQGPVYTLSLFVAASGLDYQARAKGHTYIVPQFFKLLQECFLTHNWLGAVKILQALAYEPKGTSQTIWKVHDLPKSPL